MKLVIGRHSATQQSQQLGEGEAAEPYTRVLEMDAALQAEISKIELTRQDSNPKRRPCTPTFSHLVSAEIGDSSSLARADHRALLLMILQNRVIRIHRKCSSLLSRGSLLTPSLLGPYFMRGFRDERFHQSSTACLRASKAVCEGLEFLRTEDGNLEHVSPRVLSCPQLGALGFREMR